MHHIQAKILNQLLYVEASGYADMRPEGVESNLFAYHLEQLLKEKLIVKEAKRYRLSASGLALLDRLSQVSMKHRLQPHIVTAVDVTTDRGETLLFRRNFQPYFHLLGFPLGKIHFGEGIPAAAVRELAEKTGLEGVALTHRGMAYIEARQQGVIISKALYHVFHGDVSAALPTTTPPHRGMCEWADHTQLDPSECMPGFLKIKSLLEKLDDTLFFAEILEDIAG